MHSENIKLLACAVIFDAMRGKAEGNKEDRKFIMGEGLSNFIELFGLDLNANCLRKPNIRIADRRWLRDED